MKKVMLLSVAVMIVVLVIALPRAVKAQETDASIVIEPKYILIDKAYTTLNGEVDRELGYVYEFDGRAVLIGWDGSVTELCCGGCDETSGVVQDKPTPTPEPTPDPTKKPKCNRGIGNNSEGCDPGNSSGQGQGQGRDAGEDRDEHKKDK